jgi:hypothetical protein
MRVGITLMVLMIYGFFTVGSVRAEIRINEVFPNPEGSPEVDEFIEIYNTTDEVLDLSGWTLMDTVGSPKVYTFPQIVLEGKKIFVFRHDITKIVLNNTSDGVVLKNASGDVIDEMTFDQSEEGISVGRYPDGTGEFFSMLPTEGSNNIQPPTPTPTNTPVPTNTPTPTKTSTPTKTLTPTRTLTPTKNISPTNVLSVSKSEKNDSAEIDEHEEAEAENEGASSESAEFTYQKGSSQSDKKSSSKLPEVLGVQDSKGELAIIVGGSLLLGACGILVYRKYRYIFFK